MSQLRDAVDSPRNRRLGKWLAGSFLVLVLLGFFVAPPVLKSVLLTQLAKALHREVAIERIDINPLALSATVAGVSVRGESGEVAGFDELYVNLSSSSLFQLAAVVDELRLSGLRIAVARLDEGRYDISDLLDKWMLPDDEPDSGPPRFSVNNIQLLGGKVVFADQPRERVHTISDINLALPFVSSLPYQAEILVQPMFSANVNGSQFNLDGKTTPFADGRESELNLVLDDFDLSALQPYLPASVPLRIDSALLATQLKAVFKELPGGVNSLVLLGKTQVSALKLATREGQPLLGWKTLAVDLEQIDPFNRMFAVQKVAVDGVDLNLTVNRAGELNLLALAQRLTAAPAPEKAAEAASPLGWSLGQFVLSNGLVRWSDASGAQPVTGEVRELALRFGRVDSKLAAPLEIAEASWQLDFGERLQVGRMALKDVRIDLATQRIDVAELSNSATRIAVTRNAAGAIEWITPPRLKAAAGKAGTGEARPWLVQVGRLDVEDLGLRFEDKSVQPAALQQIDALSIHGEKLGNVPNEKGRLALKAAVNKQGSLEITGDLQAVPFAATLKVDGKAIPLNGLQGYSGQYLNVTLQRGQFSSQGEVVVRLDRDKLKAGYKGSATLGNLLAVDPENKADFLKWKSLHFGGIDFRLDPLAIEIREIALSDFFSRLILNQDGRLNVADIVRKPAVETPVVAEVAPVVSAAPAPAVPIRIGKVTLNNGTVNFSDFFVKPNYTVNVGKLGGRVTGLSSSDGTTADMELRGVYGGSAPVLLTAKLNPLAAQSYLDLQAEVKGVDLTGLSPYSGKYAGYVIDKGKLTLNVAYKLENKQLTADNHLFIDQFTFGERVDSPDATSLPVNLAIALLRNNRGEIDIRLPISGSLDDPQFSVGGLIVKVIVNLFVKAVTSPFALLGSMFGGGEELSNLAFVAGRTQLDAAALNKLQALARALNERSALRLEITGQADPEIDREGVKRVAIERAMQKEKFADLQKKGGDIESADMLRIEPEEYKAYLTRVYRAAKFPKPRNFIGLQKELPVEEMEKLMLANLPAGDDDLRQLAKQRAEAVQIWLIEQGKVPAERLFLVPPKDNAPGGSRVDFALR